MTGYEPGSDPAFCGILSTVVINGERVDADYPILAGYEAWNYLAFIILPVLFLSTMCQNRRINKIDQKVGTIKLSKLFCVLILMIHCSIITTTAAT